MEDIPDAVYERIQAEIKSTEAPSVQPADLPKQVAKGEFDNVGVRKVTRAQEDQANMQLQVSTLLAEIGNKKAVISNNTANVYTESGAAAAENVVRAGVMKMSAESTVTRAVNNLSAQIMDPTSNYAVAQSDAAEMTRRGRETARIIEQKQSVGFFDNPLQFIANQVTLPGDIAKHNAIAVRYDNANTTLRNIDMSLTGAAARVRATAETTDSVMIKNEAIVTRNNAEVLANNARLQGLNSNAESITAIGNGQTALTNAVTAANAATNQEEQLAISRQRQKREDEIWAERQAEIADKKQVKESDIGILRDGMAILGLPVTDGTRLDAMFKNPRMKDLTELAYKRGLAVMAEGAPSLGISVGDSAEVLVKTRGVFKGQNETAVKWAAELATTTPPMPGEKVEGTRGRINDRAKNQITIAQSNAEFLPVTKAPPISSLARMPIVSNSVFFQRVLKPQIDAGTVDWEPQGLLDLTLAAVAAKTVTLEDAAVGIARIYDTSLKINNENLRFIGAPQLKDYNVKFAGIGMFDGSTRALNQPQEVMGALAGRARTRAIEEGMKKKLFDAFGPGAGQ